MAVFFENDHDYFTPPILLLSGVALFYGKGFFCFVGNRKM